MKEDSPPPSTFDPGTILSGMTGSGKFRAVFISGPSNQAKAKKLAELGTAIARTEPTSFCALIDCRKTSNPYEWCSQFARTLRTMGGAEPMALAKFAMGVGRSLIPFRPGGKESSPENEANEKVVAKLVEEFEALTEHLPKGNNSPKLVIILDRFESMGNEMLEWISSTLNHAFRESSSFKACRFIFSAQQKSNVLEDFFSKFGFEHVHEFIFGGLANPSEVSTIEKRVPVDADPLPTASVSLEEPKQTKELKSSNVQPSVTETMDAKLEENLQNAKDFFSAYDETQKEFLFLSAYAGNISRYNLEFFTDPRKAALCYNWVKRQTKLCERLSDGNLSLREDVKGHARILHEQDNPEESEKWSTLSSVLEVFFKQFPDPESHWIPVNLQLLSWFDDHLLEKLFDDDQNSSIKSFLQLHENTFVEDEGKRSLTEDKKVLTRRLLSLSHLEPLPGLLDKAKEQWLLDSEKASNKQNRLENEKKNLTADIEGSLQEIAGLSSMKEKLSEELSNPGILKPQRILSFSSSLILIVIGIGTMGLSLMSESLGSYHAACGLGLTLFGFFWPGVEIKRAAETAAISNSPLTVDAQQRSLDHRISNLSNRLNVMKGNLIEVEKQITKLEGKTSEPYVEIDE
jgi:hypothetical protein